nr:hypothetical protein XYFPCFBP8417_10505 [Xylella fastidiosa subsp. multiplex]
MKLTANSSITAISRERVSFIGIAAQNVSLIKVDKVPVEALLQRHAGGAAIMAPRPVGIRCLLKQRQYYQEIP